MLTDRPGLEASLARAVSWVLLGGAVTVALLALPVPASPPLLTVATLHLVALVSFGLIVLWDLARYLEHDWFQWLSPQVRQLAAGASTVAIAVGVVALITLASSAALRLAPSLQFLQLLSALDIAWVAGATMVGVRWLVGKGAGAAAGIAVGMVCIWSIWNYLRVVGFAPDGGWQVDAGALFRYVLPYDLAAAAVAVAVLIAGARRSAGVLKQSVAAL